MKTKYLFGMLLSGAMLAACTAEDDFDAANKVAKVNPSAPVFTVSFEKDGDSQNRAVFNENLWQVGFEANDKLSLYHGMGDYATLANWQHAIYKGEQEELNGELGDFKFTTEAMVQPGKAILIYPADLEGKNGWGNGNGAPRIRIPQNQTSVTKTQTPYMSEVLTIDDYGTEGTTAEAGYGKEYEVALKRVGSTLTLNMDLQNAPDLPSDVDAIAVSKVELNDRYGYSPFTLEVPVKGLAAPSYARNDNEGEEAYLAWNNQSDLDLENRRDFTNIISTTDVEDNTATFTLLPVGANTLYTYNDEVKFTYTNVEIIVNTNYGKVTLTTRNEVFYPWNANNLTEEDLIWHNKDFTEDMTIKAGMDFVFEHLWWKNTTSKKFKGEFNGTHVTGNVDVDVTELNMNGLHIKTEKQLIDVSKVIDIFGLKDEQNIFYIDGDEKTGEFTIASEAGYNAYKYLIGEEVNGKKLTLEEDQTLELRLCKEENEVCKVVVLKNATEVKGVVPNVMKFGKEYTTDKVLVQLDGEGWLLKNTQTFVNVDTLVVAKDAVLELQGTVNVANPDYVKDVTPAKEQFVATTALVNRAGGTINAKTGDIKLQMNTRNYGTINVDTRLRMSGLNVKDIDGSDDASITLVNDVYAKKYAYGTDDKSERGVIYLNNRLATVDNTNARVYNFGYIEVLQEAGSVLLYANGTENAKFGTAFKNAAWGKDNISELHAGDNIFGVLKVISNANSLSLTTILNDAAATATNPDKKNMKGFVKYDAGTGAMSKPSTDTNNLINYVKGGSFASSGGMTMFCELASGSGVVKSGTYTIDDAGGLIVPSGVTVTIEVNKILTVPYIYLKGEIYKAGTLTVKGDVNGSHFVSYMGGSKNDLYNVSSAGAN